MHGLSFETTRQIWRGLKSTKKDNLLNARVKFGKPWWDFQEETCIQFVVYTIYEMLFDTTMILSTKQLCFY